MKPLLKIIKKKEQQDTIIQTANYFMKHFIKMINGGMKIKNVGWISNQSCLKIHKREGIAKGYYENGEIKFENTKKEIEK